MAPCKARGRTLRLCNIWKSKAQLSEYENAFVCEVYLFAAANWNQHLKQYPRDIDNYLTLYRLRTNPCQKSSSNCLVYYGLHTRSLKYNVRTKSFSAIKCFSGFHRHITTCEKQSVESSLFWRNQ